MEVLLGLTIVMIVFCIWLMIVQKKEEMEFNQKLQSYLEYEFKFKFNKELFDGKFNGK